MTISATFLCFFTEPESIRKQTFTNSQWQQLLTLARASNLLAKFAYIATEYMEYIPCRVQKHLESAITIATRHRQSVMHEIAEIYKVAKSIDITILKGGAYLIHDYPNAQGRMLSDLDILVDRNDLKQLEIKCLLNGWIRTESEEYNDRYYRKWMHEIPPLTNLKRGTVVDIHHNILPLTNRQCPDPAQFEHQTIKHEILGEITTLSDKDLFIHSATHLFSESEFNNGLRDLIDLFQLLEYFEKEQSNFIEHSYIRARNLGLEEYLYLALTLINKCLIKSNQKKINLTNINSPFSNTHLNLLEKAFIKVFEPSYSLNNTISDNLASFFLYCRGHNLRMPIKLLIPHLLTKLYMQIQKKWQKDSIEKFPNTQ